MIPPYGKKPTLPMFQRFVKPYQYDVLQLLTWIEREHPEDPLIQEVFAQMTLQSKHIPFRLQITAKSFNRKIAQPYLEALRELIKENDLSLRDYAVHAEYVNMMQFPTKTNYFTTIRSPHVHKKHRDQFKRVDCKGSFFYRKHLEMDPHAVGYVCTSLQHVKYRGVELSWQIMYQSDLPVFYDSYYEDGTPTIKFDLSETENFMGRTHHIFTIYFSVLQQTLLDDVTCFLWFGDRDVDPMSYRHRLFHVEDKLSIEPWTTTLKSYSEFQATEPHYPHN